MCKKIVIHGENFVDFFVFFRTGIDFFAEKRYNKYAMNHYQYVQAFNIKYCDADFKEKMKVSTFLSFMEEGACWSAEELGFGANYLKAKGYTFIVSANCIEFLRPVCVGEKPVLHTWPNKPSYVVFERQYELIDEAENMVAHAASRWCIVETGTSKIVPSKNIDNQDYSTYRTDKTLENVRWKIATFDVDGEEPRFSIKIANSEYDHNMHVNNTRYADYCLNVFTVAELSDKWVKRFSIAYLKQCKEGETLRFYRRQTGENTYIAQGVNERDEIVVAAEILLEKF